MKQGKLRIGTSGFSYDDWLGNFYPQFCPKADYLQFYSSKFNIVEIDSTYYRIPQADMVKRWVKVTPDDFLFTAKFPKFVTHEGTIEKRLEYLKAFVKVMKQLGSKQGPLLMQFPYSFKPDQMENLKQLVAHLPENKQISIELRNKKWLEEKELFPLLEEKNISLCLIDHPWMPKLNKTTADFAYFRFLGDRKKIESDFSYVRNECEQELDYWAKVILELTASGKDCFAFFNNHFSGHSPTTAERFIERLENLQPEILKI